MTTSEILEFIKNAHGGQLYGDGSDYWHHPVAVAETGKLVFGSDFTETSYQIALLHDVVEDTKYTLHNLINLGIDQDVISGVDLLTKDKSLTYKENIDRIIKSSNKNAVMVKISDNISNLTSSMRSFDVDTRNRLVSKYSLSFLQLSKAL